MVLSAVTMYNPAMPTFYFPTADETFGQALHVVADGRPYFVRIDHATTHNTQRSERRHLSLNEHTHDLYHVVLYCGAENEFAMNGQRLPVRRGTLVLTGPGVPHNYGALLPGTTQYHEVTFSLISDVGEPLRIPPHRLLSLLSGVNLAPVNWPRQLPAADTDELERSFKTMLDALVSRSQASASSGAHMLCGMLLAIARRFFIGEGDVAPAPSPVAAAMRHIERHFTEPLSPRQLARRACMSERNFYRAFRDACGCTPLQYAHKLRNDAAKSLLRTTGLRCKEIASRLGYADTYHLSRDFKKHTGQSPTDWRNSGRG